MLNATKHREFFPAGRRRESVEVKKRDAMHRGLADLYNSPQINESLVFDLILSEQFGSFIEYRSLVIGPLCLSILLDPSQNGLQGLKGAHNHGKGS